MPIPNILLKDPTESKLYSIDFSAGLSSGETLSTVTASGSPTGLTIGTPTASGSLAIVRLSGGTAGTTYTITVDATTSNSNTLEECIKLAVQDCGWLQEMVVMLRYLIGDLESPPTYSDVRLAQTLCVAAKYVVNEINLENDYTINSSNLTITPDPTTLSTPDLVFMNFSVLKAACIIDTAALRSQAKLAGLAAWLGPLKLDTNRYAQGLLEVIKNGPCKSYEDQQFEYNVCGNPAIKGILGPFVGNQFEIANYYYSYDRRDHYMGGV